MAITDKLKLILSILDSFLLLLFTHWPGLLGNQLRYAYFRKKLRSLGQACIIDQGVVITNPQNVSIGDYTWIDKNVIIIGGGGVKIGRRVHIAHNCLIQGGGIVEIHDYVGIAAGTIIHSSTDTIYHGKRVGPMVPPKYRNPVVKKTVVIEKDAFIGSHCVILPGVTIGNGSVIGACSLVISDIPPWKVAVGTPAKPFKNRPPITVGDI